MEQDINHFSRMRNIFNRTSNVSKSDVSNMLNCLFEQVLVFWRQELKYEGYMIYVNTGGITDLSYGYVYGWQENHAVLYGCDDHRTVDEIYSKIFQQDHHYVTKVAIFNKEEIYFYEIKSREGGLYVSIGMSSLIFGRSNLHIADIIFNDVRKEWEIEASSYARAHNLNGFKGHLEECMWKIIRNEMSLECPYADMIEDYPLEYREAMQGQFVISVSPDGVRLNNYFGVGV